MVADRRRTRLAWFGLFSGPALAAALFASPYWGWSLSDGKPQLNRMAAVAALMAVWWLTDAVAAAITGLLPVVLLPLWNLAPPSEVAAAYGNRLLFLFLGGFLVALAIEESGLHRRIALAIVAAVGSSPARLVLGFMLATGMISMWMSNTATTILMLPIATSLLLRVDHQGTPTAATRNFGIALMLGVAYAASIGGMATLIGTPTNVLFKELYTASFAGRAPEVTFGGWMLMGVPLSLTFLCAGWLVLTKFLFPLGNDAPFAGTEFADSERRQLGPVRAAERRAGGIFLLTALLWVFREPLPGWGWAPALGVVRDTLTHVDRIDDASIAIVMAALCFLVPREGWSGPALLDWKTTARVPWGVLLLFGGGLALAQGMSHTGLDVYLGKMLGANLVGYPPLLIVTAVALAITLLSELTSNIACVNISLPVLATLAQTVDCDPRLLMIPATLAASCGFMLPVATAPNAIAFGTGRMEVLDMAKAGVWFDLLGVALIVVLVLLVGVPALGISLEGLPTWATAGQAGP